MLNGKRRGGSKARSRRRGDGVGRNQVIENKGKGKETEEKWDVQGEVECEAEYMRIIVY